LNCIDLDPLSAAEARELLGDAVETAAAANLYQESGGNPFYLEQLARSLVRGTRSSAGSARLLSEVGVPPAIAASLREELGSVSDEARTLLQGASVAGDPFEPELAAAAAATSEAAAIDALDELLQLDLVRPTDVPRRFRFRHPLIRRAVYEATVGGWRLAAHERCAEALAAQGASAAARAPHVERSAREGDLVAVAVLREAGDAAVRLAPETAARLFGEAFRLLPRTASAEDRIEYLVARAGALTAAGYYADSHGALLDALGIVPYESHATFARLTRACAAVETLLERHEQAGDRLAKALGSCPAPDSPEAVAILIELAMNGFWRSSYEVMHQSAERAVHAARRLSDVPLTAAALAVCAMADSMMGAVERAESDRAEAASLVESLFDTELAQRLDAAGLLAGAELYIDRYAEADAHAERALNVARATGHGELFLMLVQILGRVWFVRGKLVQASGVLDGGIEAARLLGNTQALV
jgi:tetratricopeptide (TPR) repeat protein